MFLALASRPGFTRPGVGPTLGAGLTLRYQITNANSLRQEQRKTDQKRDERANHVTVIGDLSAHGERKSRSVSGSRWNISTGDACYHTVLRFDPSTVTASVKGQDWDVGGVSGPAESFN